MNTVRCVVLGREAEAMSVPPRPGETGRRILENVSREGWERWLAHELAFINAHRLSPDDPASRARIDAEMERFLFGEHAAAP